MAGEARAAAPTNATETRVRPGLRSNAIWALVASGATLGAQWLITVGVARLLGPEAVGLFALGSAVAVPIVTFSQLALRHALITDDSDRHTFADYRRLRLRTTFVAFLIILLVAWASGHAGTAWLVIAIVGAARCVESLNDIFLARLHRSQRLDRIAQVAIIHGTLALVFSTGALLVTRSVVGVSVGFACAYIAILALLASDTGRSDTLASGPGNVRELALRALPLAVAHMLVALNAQLPRYVIMAVGGASDVGQYAAVEQLVAAVNLAATAVGSAALPRLAELWRSGDKSSFQRVLARLILANITIALVGAAAAAAAGDLVIRLAYGESFAVAARAFPWLIAASGVVLVANALGMAITAQARFVAPIPVSILALAMGAPLSYWGASRFGVVGVTAGTAGSALTQAAIYGYLLTRASWEPKNGAVQT